MKRAKVTIRLVKHATNIFLKCYIFFCEQATKSDRIYVNSPEAQAGDNGNIAILSFKQSSKLEEEGGIHNEIYQQRVFLLESNAIMKTKIEES